MFQKLLLRNKVLNEFIFLLLFYIKKAILNKIKSEWKSINFELSEFCDSQCHILKNFDPITDKLDENISKL